MALPPKKSPTLTEAELRLMEVLWQNGPATVQEILQGLPETAPLAYNSVLTTIRILEQKGYVKHVKDGRAHVYTPLIQREEATRSEIRRLVNRFFPQPGRDQMDTGNRKSQLLKPVRMRMVGQRREKLEQLRALEAGMRIDVAIVASVPLGVDTPDDLAIARAMLAKRRLDHQR